MRVNLKDIAEALGISTQTVSMALRNHNRISEETKKRVRDMAAKMGYQRDPSLQSLAAYRSRKQNSGLRWQRIALVHDWPSEDIWLGDNFARSFVEKLTTRAGERGVQIEEYWLGHHSINAESRFRQIYNKGITGIIVAPHALDREPVLVPIPEGQFQVVTCGPENLYPSMLTVQFDYYENLRLAWDVLRKKGYQRIGLAYQEIHGWRTGYAWKAAYHIEKSLAQIPSNELPPFVVNNVPAKSHRACISWIQKQRLAAIITSSYQVYDWAREVNPDIYVAEMNPTKPDRAGINLNMDEYCKCLLDILSVAMQHSLAVETTFPYRVHVPGFWTEPG